jgi:hypothetical protein
MVSGQRAGESGEGQSAGEGCGRGEARPGLAWSAVGESRDYPHLHTCEEVHDLPLVRGAARVRGRCLRKDPIN